MAEISRFTKRNIDDEFIEVVDEYKIVTRNGNEQLLVFRVWDNVENKIKTLRNEGREVLKVMYTGPDNVTICQAFYRSTGFHLRAEQYSEVKEETAIRTERSWVPFDGIGILDETYCVDLKIKVNWNPTEENFIKWKKHSPVFYKCSYFGHELAYQFGEAITEAGLSIFHSDDPKTNKNFDLARYGDLKTLRISFLLSSGDVQKPPLWESELGQRMIQTLGFEIDDEFEISIPSEYIDDVSDKDINKFVSNFVSFNWKNGSSVLGPNYFIDKRKRRKYDLRYSYMPTSSGEMVMFEPYLHTNPDSRLPFEAQSREAKRIKETYDFFDSEFTGPFRHSISGFLSKKEKK